MTSRLVVLGLFALAAVAAADSFRGDPKERPASQGRTHTPSRLVGNPVPQYVAEGKNTRTRILRRGREYLTAAQIDAAFPAPLEGLPFDVAHLAAGPDGTLALAVYKFPATGPVRAGIELWRDGELVGAFTVPAGSFGGGLGFTADGSLVATVSPDGRSAILFSRDGEPMARIPVTRW